MPVEVEVHTVLHFKAPVIVKRDAKDKRMLAFLRSKIALLEYDI